MTVQVIAPFHLLGVDMLAGYFSVAIAVLTKRETEFALAAGKVKVDTHKNPGTQLFLLTD